MPGNKSDFLELKLLDHVLGGSDYSRPATVYLGLFSVAPTDAGGGTELTGGAQGIARAVGALFQPGASSDSLIATASNEPAVSATATNESAITMTASNDEL